jgi:mono/diheme cytochrome c family protein
MIAATLEKTTLRTIALMVLLVVAIPYSAAAQSANGGGQKLYDQNCAKCHGVDGSGNTTIGKAVGAKDLRSPEAKKLTDAQISSQISQGKGNMPPFAGTLDSAEINSLIPIIRELSKNTSASKKPS